MLRSNPQILLQIQRAWLFVSQQVSRTELRSWDTYVSGGIFIWAWVAVVHRKKNPRILRSFTTRGILSSIALQKFHKLGSALKVGEDHEEFVGNGFLMLAKVSRRWWRRWRRWRWSYPWVVDPESSLSCLHELDLLPASSRHPRGNFKKSLNLWETEQKK